MDHQSLHTILPKLLPEVLVVLDLFLPEAQFQVCAGVKVLLEASIGEECPTGCISFEFSDGQGANVAASKRAAFKK